MFKKIILTLAIATASMTMMAQQKFAYFNPQNIVPTMPEFTKAQQEVQTLEKQYTEDLQRMQTELQNKAKEYQAQADSLPAAIRERREQELQQLQERLQQTYTDNQQALQKASAERMQAIQAKLTAAVEEIGKADGYVFVIDETQGFPFINKSICVDITAKIKTKLGLK